MRIIEIITQQNILYYETIKQNSQIRFPAIITAVTLLIVFVGTTILFNTWEAFEIPWKEIGWAFAGVGVLLTPVFMATAIFEVFKLKYKSGQKTEGEKDLPKYSV